MVRTHQYTLVWMSTVKVSLLFNLQQSEAQVYTYVIIVMSTKKRPIGSLRLYII